MGGNSEFWPVAGELSRHARQHTIGARKDPQATCRPARRPPSDRQSSLILIGSSTVILPCDSEPPWRRLTHGHRQYVPRCRTWSNFPNLVLPLGYRRVIHDRDIFQPRLNVAGSGFAIVANLQKKLLRCATFLPGDLCPKFCFPGLLLAGLITRFPETTHPGNRRADANPKTGRGRPARQAARLNRRNEIT